MSRNWRYRIAAGEGAASACGPWLRGLPMRNGSGSGPGGETGGMALCIRVSSCASAAKVPRKTMVHRTAVTRAIRFSLLKFALVRKILISFVLASVAVCAGDTIQLKNGRNIANAEHVREKD